MTSPIGYFVHHQGRGHAERAAAIAHALDATTPVTFFCARDDIFPPLPAHAQVVTISSLFEEPADVAPRWSGAATPDVMHCAPLGWPTITAAVATLTRWFEAARPALFVTDVSAELGLLARIASVPCVSVLQHGARGDPGHMAAYQSAVGILAPYSQALEQDGRPGWMTEKTGYFGGLGIGTETMDRAAARRTLGLPSDADIVLTVAGGGGSGTPATPLTLGARAEPDSLWVTIGEVAHEWHATAPGNLRHMGWVDNPGTWIAAANRIVSSTGNTTVHMVATAGRPWIVVPEWRYFDEQLEKARALAAAGAAVALDHWPSHAGAWESAWADAARLDPAAQRALIDPAAATRAAEWLRGLAQPVSPPTPQPNLIAEFVA